MPVITLNGPNQHIEGWFAMLAGIQDARITSVGATSVTLAVFATGAEYTLTGTGLAATTDPGSGWQYLSAGTIQTFGFVAFFGATPTNVTAMGLSAADLGAAMLADDQTGGVFPGTGSPAVENLLLGLRYQINGSAFDDYQFNGGNSSDGIPLIPTGNNIYKLGDGFDQIIAGAGSDRILGEGGKLNASGGAGNDVIVGGTVGDNLSGDAGRDSLYGGLGDDFLGGGDGNDFLEAGDGADSAYGGIGGDTLNGGEGNDRLLGEANSDSLAGDAGNDSLFGEDGNDTLNGEGGNDTLSGGAGDDYLDGGTAGLDSLLGDSGNDMIFGQAGRDILDGGIGLDTLYGGEADDRLAGQSDADTLWGENGNDRLSGGSGNDELRGGDGKDTLTGEGGHDFLEGGSEDDILNGGSGNDVLVGGLGADVMTGGIGADTFRFLSAGELVGDTDWDRISDFQSGVDVIVLFFPMTFIGSGPFTGTAGQLRWDAASLSLSFDLDGNGVGDATLYVSGNAPLASGDIIF